MAKRLQAFTVQATVEIQCSIDIRAESLEDAIEKARTLKETDFVTVLDAYNDGSLTITGIFECS